MAYKAAGRSQMGDRSVKEFNGAEKPRPDHEMANRKVDDYRSEGVSDHDIFSLPGSDYQLLGLLTVLGAIVRLFRIYQPSSVVFDEVQYVLHTRISYIRHSPRVLSLKGINSFGGFASKYIKGRFFMDVHPPLAKLLLTLAGWLAGFNGDFDFKDIGKDYLEPKVPYVAMRLLPAVCGILTIPTMFLTLKAYGCRTTTAALGAGLIIFGKRLSSELEYGC